MWRWDIKLRRKVCKQDWFNLETLPIENLSGSTEMKTLIYKNSLSLWYLSQDRLESRISRDGLCEEKHWKDGSHNVFGTLWVAWLGQFSSVCSHSPSLPAFSQGLRYRAPDPHLAGPGAGPAGFKNLARPAGSGDLNAEGTEGTAGTSSKSGRKRVATVGEGWWEVSTAAEACGETSESYLPWGFVPLSGEILGTGDFGESVNEAWALLVSPVCHMQLYQAVSPEPFHSPAERFAALAEVWIWQVTDAICCAKCVPPVCRRCGVWWLALTLLYITPSAMHRAPSQLLGFLSTSAGSRQRPGYAGTRGRRQLVWGALWGAVCADLLP